MINKIKRLLALATSCNENEAKLALAKAHELMLKHKIEEREIVEQEEIHEVATSVSFSSRRDVWIPRFMGKIARHYSCESFVNPYPNKPLTKLVCFLGYKKDVAACVVMFEFVIEFIRKKNRKRDRELYKNGFSAAKRDSVKYSYARGFVDGFTSIMEEQTEQYKQEYGLVLLVPEEVKQKTSHMRRCTLRVNKEISENEYHNGYKDGVKNAPSKKNQKNRRVEGV